MILFGKLLVCIYGPYNYWYEKYKLVSGGPSCNSKTAKINQAKTIFRKFRNLYVIFAIFEILYRLFIHTLSSLHRISWNHAIALASPGEKGRPIIDGGVAGCRGRLALAAGDAAVDGPVAWQEGPAQQRGPAGGAAEATLVGVPMLALVRHLALVHADRLATAVAVLGE